MDNGNISTVLISIAVIILGVFVADPSLINGILEQYGLLTYTPIVVAILLAVYNYAYPRVNKQEGA
jgi:hypothetical protein